MLCDLVCEPSISLLYSTTNLLIASPPADLHCIPQLAHLEHATRPYLIRGHLAKWRATRRGQ